MNPLNRCIIPIICAIIVMATSGCSRDNTAKSLAVKGVADLRESRVNSVITALNGEWEFYPGKLLLPADFVNHKEGNPVYLKVPGDWSSVQPVRGIGTYRLKVILPDNYVHYSMKVKWIKSSAEIWIDNSILIEQGIASSSEENSEAGDFISIADFFPRGNQFNITIQVANYSDRRGGLCFPVLIAPPVIMYNLEMKLAFLSALVIGALFIVILFHFALHYYFRRLSINLYVSLACCMVLIRLLVLTDSSYINSIIKIAGLTSLVKIEFVSLVLIFIFVMQFFMKLYLYNHEGPVKRLLYWAGIVSVVYIAVAPVYYIKTALPFFQLYLLVVTVFVIISPLRNGVKRGFPGARIYMVSMLLALLGFINDIIYFLVSVGLPNISGYMFFFFLIVHFIVVTIYISEILYKNRSLVEELGLKKKIVSTLSFLSSTDSLTEIYNRRFFDSYLGDKLKEIQRDEVLWLIIFDIDFFKKVNDEYGHSMGDVVLKELSRLVRGLIRTGDILCRWGGEEFAIVLSGMDETGVRHFTERIRESIEGHSFSIERKITASFGVASYITGESPVAFLNRVDNAMYIAKKSGRNRVEFA